MIGYLDCTDFSNVFSYRHFLNTHRYQTKIFRHSERERGLQNDNGRQDERPYLPAVAYRASVCCFSAIVLMVDRGGRLVV